MKRKNPAICADCGRILGLGIAPDSSGRCERCAEAPSIRPEDRDRTDPYESADQPEESPRDPIVERLRERYYEARALVATGESEPAHRGQLDWIFGVHAGDARSAAVLDARTSELVVLWLEDLIRHLEELTAAGGPLLLAEEPGDSASPSLRAAHELHAATREFASAFRRAMGAECRP